VPPSALTPVSLVPHLERCGYDDALREQDYNFGSGRAPVAAFADTPHDVRSICIAVVDGASDPKAAVFAARPLGAPVVFACHANIVQWWKQTTGTPELRESINSRNVHVFFREHKDDFSPKNIFEGKTIRRLPDQKQLQFVDAGLMPFIERSRAQIAEPKGRAKRHQGHFLAACRQGVA
jgi:hypothetical protein